MIDIDDENDVSRKHICVACIEESYLKNYVEANGASHHCTYCGNIGQCVRIDTIADFVEEAFERCYCKTSCDPNNYETALIKDRESTFEWERHGEPIVDAIMYAAKIDEQPANDIREILDERHSDFEADKMGEETEFAEDSYYSFIGPSDDKWRQEWRAFENILKNEARYFGVAAQELLTSIFSNIQLCRTSNGKSPIIPAGPQCEISSLYRARSFQSNPELLEALKRPDLYLGPPAQKLARAGRMNAYGISVFYGATSELVAVSEVRPPVKSIVAVAKFDLIRAVNLLDIEVLSEIVATGSIFDKAHLNNLERAAFLQTVSKRISMPVLPDHEPFEYLATQVVAEFLAAKQDCQLDGIIYPSVQGDGTGRNVVLFHKSSVVEKLAIDNIEAWGPLSNGADDEEMDMSYSVFFEKMMVSTPEPSFWEKTEDAHATLRIDLSSISAKKVEQVRYTTMDGTVGYIDSPKSERDVF